MNTLPQPKRIAFLYNHEALHQIAHTAPIIPALLKYYPDVDVSVLVSSDEQLAVLRDIVGDECLQRVVPTLLIMSPALNLLTRAFSKLAPVKRVLTLRSNLNLFRQFDALVVPERTSLMLKHKFGLKHLQIIWTGHGAGDRAVAVHPNIRWVDLALLYGKKQRDRLLSLGHIRDGHYAIIGYIKFDAMKGKTHSKSDLFDQDRPTVLYNPHLEPNHSSWYDMGLDVLEYFYNQENFNLIFAPHVMLFERKIHTSIEHFKIRFRKDVPAKYRDCPHIHIDTGSNASIDMTYTSMADIYLGDVSSQIYEFLIRPRPSVFLNAAKVEWEGDSNYTHWNFGRVIPDVTDLGDSITEAVDDHKKYLPAQEKWVNDTFDLTDEPSSKRAADAIVEYLNSQDFVPPHKSGVIPPKEPGENRIPDTG